MRAAQLVRGWSGRRLVLVIASIGALAVLFVTAGDWREVRWGAVGTYDFVEYWGAAQLLRRGGNPYDAAAMLTVQQGVGWRAPEPLRLWNPPWTLALALPLAFLPFGTALMAWLTVELGLVLGGGLLLWDYFHREDRRYWMGMLLSIGFCPTLLALWMGQISPWMLLGVVGFLWAGRRAWDLAAGAALALLMIKPHVAYLFWLAALWWAWQDGRRRILVGWLAALLGASGLVLVIAPDVFANYLVALGNPPLGWHSATLGTWLRVLLGWELSWLQFLPSLLGGLGLAAWLWRRRGPWRWEVLAGPLLLVSVVTAGYGYSFDQVVLVPAVVALVEGLATKPAVPRVAILGALLASQVGLWALNHWAVPEAFAAWHAPAVAGLYWWAASGARAGGETR